MSVYARPCFEADMANPASKGPAAAQAAQNSTGLLLEGAGRMNAAAVRKAFEEGIPRMEQRWRPAGRSPG